jgi:hypothetical protein
MADNEKEETPENVKPAKPAAPSRKRSRARKKSSSAKDAKPRLVRTFPAATFEEALAVPQAIQQYAAGQKVRRLTLFDHIGKSPDSGPSRQLVTNAGKYGLTSGGYQAEYLELTADGNVATNPETSPADQLQARFRLAIERVAPFKVLYDRRALAHASRNGGAEIGIVHRLPPSLVP